MDHKNLNSVTAHRRKKIHGEAMASSVNDIDEGRQNLVESLSGYNLDNLYNMDEAALFISCNQTLRSQQKCQTFVHIV